MKATALSLACTAALLLTSCNIKQKHARNSEATAAWLAANKSTPSTKISGSWTPGDPDWGSLRLEQHGGTITGSIGSYHVDGTVSGKTAFLAMKESGWTYYTAILNRSGNDFVGFYSDAVPFQSDSQSPMVLTPLQQ